MNETRAPSSLVAALTVSGLLSGVYTENFLWWHKWDVWPFAAYKLLLLTGVSFGLSIAAVLWFYRLIRSWKTVIVLLAVTIAVYFFSSSPAIAPVIVSPFFTLLIGIFVFLLFQLAAFLYLLVPRRGARRICRIALIYSGLAALLFAGVLAVLGAGTTGLTPGNLLLDLFGEAGRQTGLACLLGIALCVKPDTLQASSPQPRRTAPRASRWSRFAVFPVLLGYFVLVGVWSSRAQVRVSREKRELQVRLSTEAAQSLAEAPSLERLPELKREPVNDVLLVQEIAGWVPSQPASSDLPAEPTGISGYLPYAASPRRIRYDISYWKGDQGVMLQITQYPNPEWARYWLRNTPMPNSLIEDRGISRLSKFGNYLYSDKVNFYWPSGDKLIFLSCSGLQPDVIDEFLKAYLAKYPSSI